MRKTLFKVLLDCDAVLADLAGYIHEKIHRKTGVKYDLKGWRFGDYMTKDHALLADSMLNQPGINQKFPVLEGAQDGVELLRSQDCEIFCVTSSWIGNPTWEWDRRKWLKRHFQIDNRHIIFGAAKFLVSGGVLVDDKPKHVKSWGDYWNRPGLMYAYGFSEHEPLCKFNWSHVLDVEWEGHTFADAHRVMCENRLVQTIPEALESLKENRGTN